MKPTVYSEDRKIVIWYHDGKHGTRGLVTLEGEWEAVIVQKTFSIGRKKLSGAHKLWPL